MNEKEQLPMTEKENVRWRVANAHIDPDNYVFYPAKKQVDYYDNDIPQRVAIYVRVSTDSSKQTMSYELQKKYYEEFVVQHPCWTLVKIYADEAVIIGLKPPSTNGRRFSPISITRHFPI